MTRRSPTLKERQKPCRCCGYSISQRHHLLNHSTYQENNFTWHLCAGCHEVYHLIENVARTQDDFWTNPNTKAGKLLLRLYRTEEDGPKKIAYLIDVHNLAIGAKNEIEAMKDKIYQETEKEIIEKLKKQGWCILPPENIVVEDIAAHIVDGDLFGKRAIKLLYQVTQSDLNQKLVNKIKLFLKQVGHETDKFFEPLHGKTLVSLRTLRSYGYIIIHPDNVGKKQCSTCGTPYPEEQEDQVSNQQ